jgi:hypothetical protein
VRLERTRQDEPARRVALDGRQHSQAVGRPVWHRIEPEPAGQEVACGVDQRARLVGALEMQLERVDALEAQLGRAD